VGKVEKIGGRTTWGGQWPPEYNELEGIGLP